MIMHREIPPTFTGQSFTEKWMHGESMLSNKEKEPKRKKVWDFIKSIKSH